MRLATFAIFFPLFTGCVTSGKYDAAIKERDELKAQNAQLTTQLTKAGGRITKLDQNLTNTTQQKNQMAKAFSELQQRQQEADKRLNEFRQLTAKFQSLVDAKTLLLKIDRGRMVVAMATDVLFPSGSAILSKNGKEAAAKVGELLATIEDREFQVEGHTDNVPIGTARFASNWELASARALNVLDVLVKAGVPANRISAASFGDSRPEQSNDAPAGRAANRRIEIVVVPDLSGLPGYQELTRMAN